MSVPRRAHRIDRPPAMSLLKINIILHENTPARTRATDKKRRRCSRHRRDAQYARVVLVAAGRSRFALNPPAICHFAHAGDTLRPYLSLAALFADHLQRSRLPGAPVSGQIDDSKVAIANYPLHVEHFVYFGRQCALRWSLM